jgi:hypothetical protein
MDYLNSRNGHFGGAGGVGIARKKRIVILLKTQLIKEDNDACKSRGNS